MPVFDAGQVDGTYCIASAFVEGISLRAAIRAGQFADRRAAAELLVKLAELRRTMPTIKASSIAT